MSTVVEIRSADDPRDVIHRAVQLLSAGELVGFPTETVYVVAAHALLPSAVGRLQRLSQDGRGACVTLALKSGDEALDYVPQMSPFGRKLVRRCWPGPVTLSFDVSQPAGLVAALPEEVRSALVCDGAISLRVPAHEVIFEVLRLMPAPLVISPESTDRLPPVTTAAELADRFGDAAALIISDGPSRYAQPSTVVRVAEETWRIVRPGVITETTILRLASEVYLFVCTGNTCRSPMAEGLFRKFLAEKLKCREDELIDRGYVVASAGLAAAVGAPASPESIELLKRQGIDLRSHESQPLTGRLLDQADHVFTMTRSHRDAILAERPELANRVRSLARNGRDVSDPIGGGMGEYEQCQAEIEGHIREILDEMETR